MRPATASNVDLPLMAALSDKLPLLRDDYSKPMLRFDLVLNLKRSENVRVRACVCVRMSCPRAAEGVLGCGFRVSGLRFRV